MKSASSVLKTLEYCKYAIKLAILPSLMVTASETEWARPPQETQMRLEDFEDILGERIEGVRFVPMSVDGILSDAKTYDNLGRRKYRISINSNDPEIEQAKTLVHEIAHVHYESPYINIMEQIRVEEDAYEDFIKEETERFFAEHSDSVMQIFGLVHLSGSVS